MINRDNRFRIQTIILSFAALVALVAVIRRLTPDIDPPPEQLTLSLIKDQAFIKTVKSEPESIKEKILVDAAKMLLSEIHTVTDNKHQDFVHDDFEKVIPVIDFMLAIDPENGHAIYFRGEVFRLLRDDARFTECFRRYLEVENSIGPRFPKVIDGQSCYETPHGYCEQRTAWISQLLANYYYGNGLRNPDDQAKSKLSILPGNICVTSGLISRLAFLKVQCHGQLLGWKPDVE